MSIAAAFKVHPALALAFAGARGFGLVIACDGGRPVAANVPFVLIEADGKSPRLAFHVARGNPLAALAAKGGNWLVAVTGPDAYVSADWYASRDQVPTWLYESVQLGGPVRVEPPGQTRAHLDALTARFEAQPAWTAERLAPPRLDMLAQAIVVIDMLVETAEGRFKLNQHKNDADHVAVANALGGQQDPAARAIAARMVALRPHLLYQKAKDGSAQAVGAAQSHGGGI